MGCSYSSNRTGEITKEMMIDWSNLRSGIAKLIAMVTTETEEMMIDWSNLPSDIAKLIAERVATNLADYIKFRAVCPSWRDVTVDPRHLNFPPQLPWLLLRTTSANPLPFISISDVKPRSLPLPEAAGKTILFSSDGWLVVEESPCTKINSLLNPLTHRLIHLPPLPPCEDIYDKDTRMLAIAIPSVPTSSSAKSTIMAIVGHPMSIHDPETETPTILIGLQSGSSAWTIVNKTHIYHKESFYTATLSGWVLVFNAELKEVMGVRVPVISYMSPWRLVESSGELLMVKRYVTAARKTTWFEIYELSSLDRGVTPVCEA